MPETRSPSPFTRRDVEFDSAGERCAAWLYQPKAVDRPAVVVMAHGFAGTRELALPRFAERFAERGLAVLLFDYRGFGASGGEPRQCVEPAAQQADWHAALQFVRSLDEVDRERIALWGTSFSGGHVVVVASEDPGVRAVISQVPFADARANGERPSARFVAKALGAAILDWLRARLGLQPHYLPVFAPAGEFAVLSTPGCYEGYRSLVPEGVHYRNEVAARVLFAMASYRPNLHAGKVACPVLFIPARHDNLIPLSSVEAMAQAAPRSELMVVDAGHFDVYSGALFEQVVAAEADFLMKHLAATKHAGPRELD